jgi:hypothetical protein
VRLPHPLLARFGASRAEESAESVAYEEFAGGLWSVGCNVRERVSRIGNPVTNGWYDKLWLRKSFAKIESSPWLPTASRS